MEARGSRRTAVWRRVLNVCAALVLGFAAAAAARADLLQMKDGRWIEGVKMRLEEKCIVLAYANGDVRVPLDLVEDYVIEGAVASEPATDDAKQKRADGLVSFRGKWMKPEAREKAIRDEVARRTAELLDLRAHQEWRNRWKWETKNFKFESTLAPHIGETYAATLEAYFEEMKKQWGLKVPKDWGKLTVCLYHDRKTFNEVGGARGGTLAYYRFVAPRELNCYYDRLDPEFAMACALHEATHYMVDLIAEKSNYPHWINEATAEYYGASLVDPKSRTVKIGAVQQGRLTELRTEFDVGKRLRLESLIGSNTGDYEHYYWGWSFVHFMMETPAYAKRFKDYFFDLGKAKDVQRTPGDFGMQKITGDECLRVFLKRFKLESLDALEKEWYAYIERLESTGVSGFERAGAQAYSQGAWKFRATRLLKAAIDGGSKSPQTYILYSRCLRMKRTPEGLDESLAVVEKGIRVCDPLSGDLWAERGYCLYALDRKDEGKKCVELAREMNPDDPYLDLEVMQALSGGGDE